MIEELKQPPQNMDEAENTGIPIELLRKLQEAETPKIEESAFQMVVVSLDEEWYGIRILVVREILKVKKITWVPCTPASIIGVISIRGDIQAVIDLKHFLQLSFSQVTEQSRIILVESQELVAGLLVDEMVDIIEAPERSFLPLTEVSIGAAQKYVEGKIPWHDRLITLLNVDLIIQGVIVDQG